MSITFHDRAPLEKVRKLADGRIAAVAKFARTGCQTYAGSELGRPDLATVTVYRPEDEVFSQDAMASFAHQSITLNHPQDGSVTPANWSRVSVGFTEGRVARDGGYVEIPLMLADASAIDAYESGKARELSAGYRCDLVWGDGIAPDGTRYQATQRTIRGNHIALVPTGRAGSECRIGDSMIMSDADLEGLTADQRAEVEYAIAKAKRSHETRHSWMGDRAPAFSAADRQFWIQATVATFGARAMRDAICPSQLGVARAAYDSAHARLSDERTSAWKAPAPAAGGADLRDLARLSQYR